MSRTTPCHDDPDPCDLHSGWEGDEYCLKPPAPEEGIQIHFGPKSYTDPAQTDEYAIQPGEEYNDSVLAHIPLTEERWFNHITLHARPSLHRWTFLPGAKSTREGFYPDTGCNEGTLVGSFGTSFGGGMNRVYDNPPHGIAAPENEGLGESLPGNSNACVGLHAYNFTDHPLLREIWINLYFVDQAKVTQRAKAIAMVGGLGLNLPPTEMQTLTYQGRFGSDGRIMQLFSQRHMWTKRFAVWLNDELVYDSYDWKSAVRYDYDTITTNPPIDPAGIMDGAVSGQLPVSAGDVLKFSCFIDNGSYEILRFKNDVRSGEMCNLWGATLGSAPPATTFQ